MTLNKPNRHSSDWNKRLLEEVQRIRYEYGDNSDEERNFLTRIGEARHIQNGNNPFCALGIETERVLLYDLAGNLLDLVVDKKDISANSLGVAGWMSLMTYSDELNRAAEEQSTILYNLAIVVSKRFENWNYIWKHNLDRDARINVLDLMARATEKIMFESDLSLQKLEKSIEKIVIDKHSDPHSSKDLYCPHRSAAGLEVAANVCPQTKQISYGLYADADKTDIYGHAIGLLRHEMFHRLSMRWRQAEKDADPEVLKKATSNEYLHELSYALLTQFTSNYWSMKTRESDEAQHTTYMNQPEEIIARKSQGTEDDVYRLAMPDNVRYQSKIVGSDILERYKTHLKDEAEFRIFIVAIDSYQEENQANHVATRSLQPVPN